MIKMKNYLEFERDIKDLEEELEKLKDPFNKEGLSQIETDKIYNREHLLSEIIKSFDEYSTKKDENIIKSWLKYCSHINEKVLFHSNGEKINGIFQGINSKGYAIIQMGNIIKEFSSGVIKL